MIKPGALACLIGPVHPTFPLSRFFADAWMLFPTEQEYLDWFTAAGFEDVKITRIGPKWYRGVRRHGLIMGCSVTGRKSKVRRLTLYLSPERLCCMHTHACGGDPCVYRRMYCGMGPVRSVECLCSMHE